MDEHLSGVSTRRDGRSCPTAEYNQTACWTAEYSQTARRTPDWRGVVPTATEQRGEEEGDLRPDSRVRVFSHRQNGPVPTFLSSGVPERAPGDRGWHELAGWMKAQIRGKTRNQERD
jgi:hypothetical protein